MQIKTSFIYWFAHYNMLGPCTRYRGKYLLEELNKSYGIPYLFVYPSYQRKQLAKFVYCYISALLFRKRGSIIVFQKTYTTGIYSFLLKILLFFRNKNVYYDIDDAYYVKFPPATIHYFLRNTKIIITGSRALTQYANELSNNKAKVFTLSSPIIKHDNIKTDFNKVFTIGWTGFYNYHRESLIEILFPALKMMKGEINLILLGVVKEKHFDEVTQIFKNHNNINIIMPPNIDWLNEEAFYKRLKNFDVGVSPLLDNEINRAKSAFKLKQYLCCGVPVVGSDTGENKNLILDGINGFVANNANEFFDKLIRMKEMSDDERFKMAKAARDSVEKYEMSKYGKEFIGIIENTAVYA